MTPFGRRHGCQAAALGGIERWRARAKDPSGDPLLAEAAAIAARSHEGIYLATRAVSA